tara:strand:+ start:1214 stop:1507 length:294 start_codon:yes stop_codon:yes gene_type:complete
MRSYILVDVNINDMQRFKEYATRIPELIEKHGGRYIVKGAEPKVIRSGDRIPQYVVVIEFPSVENADNFIKERESLGLTELFNQSTEGRILSVEGCI